MARTRARRAKGQNTRWLRFRRSAMCINYAAKTNVYRTSRAGEWRILYTDVCVCGVGRFSFSMAVRRWE